MPAPRKLSEAEQSMRLCHNCCISEEDTKSGLRVCGSCKLVRYCSPECQRNDWKSHKLSCQFNAEQRVRQKEYDRMCATVNGGSTPKGPISKNLTPILKTWIQYHQTVLMSSALHGLDLMRTPENISTRCLIIVLEHRGNVDLSKRFVVTGVDVLQLEDLFETLTRERGMGNVIADWKQGHQVIKASGGLGFACVALQCGDYVQICQFGFGEPLEKPIVPNWEEDLKYFTSNGKKMAAITYVGNITM